MQKDYVVEGEREGSLEGALITASKSITTQSRRGDPAA